MSSLSADRDGLFVGSFPSVLSLGVGFVIKALEGKYIPLASSLLAQMVRSGVLVVHLGKWDAGIYVRCGMKDTRDLCVWVTSDIASCCCTVSELLASLQWSPKVWSGLLIVWGPVAAIQVVGVRTHCMGAGGCNTGGGGTYSLYGGRWLQYRWWGYVLIVWGPVAAIQVVGVRTYIRTCGVYWL